MNHEHNKVWQLDKRIAFRTIEDETIIISISGGEIHLLNETASFLWNLLSAAPKSSAELISAMMASYNVDEDTAKNDVAEFLASLLAKELIAELIDA